jgi:hypothetical protein
MQQMSLRGRAKEVGLQRAPGTRCEDILFQFRDRSAIARIRGNATALFSFYEPRHNFYCNQPPITGIFSA